MLIIITFQHLVDNVNSSLCLFITSLLETKFLAAFQIEIEGLATSAFQVRQSLLVSSISFQFLYYNAV